MKKTISTKSAMISALLSLIMTVTMLLGTTYAWFTDSVTSSGNKIVAGNLDVKLHIYDEVAGDYVDISNSQTPIFGANGIAQNNAANTLWEPGKTQVVYLAIENAGTLDLKYKVVLNVLDVVGDLNEVLRYNVTPGARGDDPLTSWNASGANKVDWDEQVVSAPNVPLEAGDWHYFALSVHMDEDAGNEYMSASITFDLTVLAAQLASEEDSFGSDYDGGAEYPMIFDYEVSDKVGFLAALEAAEPGENILLNAGDYTLDGMVNISEGVGIYGAQAGVPAEKWMKDENASVTVVTVSNNSEAVFRVNQNAEGLTLNDIVIDGVLIDCAGKADNGVYTSKSKGDAMTGVVVRNCAVINSNNNGLKIKNTCGAIIENNYIAGVSDTAIAYESAKNTLVSPPTVGYIRGNVIENVGATINGAIRINSTVGDIVISDNVIRNVAGKGASAAKEAAITIYEVYEGGAIIVENNVIENCVGGVSIYKWAAKVADADKVVIRNNEITSFKNFGVMVHIPNYKNKSVIADILIKDNAFTSITSDAVVAFSSENSFRNWQVTSEGNTFGGIEGGNGFWSN